MPCNARFAEAWAFAALFCTAGYASSVDNSGLLAQAFLTDTQIDFIKLGVRANVGMRLYNVTTGLFGPVTAVTPTTLTATGVTWNTGASYRIATLDTAQRSTVEMYLDLTAADIHAALAAQDACACTWQSWVSGYLGKINIIEASMFYNCPCAQPSLSEEQKARYMEWSKDQLTQIRDGNIAVCEGDTGKTYPAFGIAEIAYTSWQELEIADNYARRNRP